MSVENLTNVENVTSDTCINVDFVTENSKILEVEPGELVGRKVEVSSQKAETERTSVGVEQEDKGKLRNMIEKLEYNLKMAEEVKRKLESKGYEVLTGGEEKGENIESMRTKRGIKENILKEKMKKLKLAYRRRTLWQRRGKKNELENFLEETERKNGGKRWKIREEMWRNEAGLTEQNVGENSWRKGLEKLVGRLEKG